MATRLTQETANATRQLFLTNREPSPADLRIYLTAEKIAADDMEYDNREKEREEQERRVRTEVELKRKASKRSTAPSQADTHLPRQSKPLNQDSDDPLPPTFFADLEDKYNEARPKAMEECCRRVQSVILRQRPKPTAFAISRVYILNGYRDGLLHHLRKGVFAGALYGSASVQSVRQENDVVVQALVHPAMLGALEHMLLPDQSRRHLCTVVLQAIALAGILFSRLSQKEKESSRKNSLATCVQLARFVGVESIVRGGNLLTASLVTMLLLLDTKVIVRKNGPELWTAFQCVEEQDHCAEGALTEYVKDGQLRRAEIPYFPPDPCKACVTMKRVCWMDGADARRCVSCTTATTKNTGRKQKAQSCGAGFRPQADAADAVKVVVDLEKGKEGQLKERRKGAGDGRGKA
ncbi:hypothetical protein EXIGLDRAFT_781659 [Exidia glandulosa HHB12029]|uniref:Uncharacterized protein n=1 Tax=Exidia glandulosa HHB12029 TaxID=1314781 RepID=A0A165Z6U1_EXIGL|nr:hypothetical protein EXIGLDRAFT_781659 [Exidia glandulosa HHB12029]